MASRGPQGLPGPRSSGGSRSYRRKARRTRARQRAAPPRRVGVFASAPGRQGFGHSPTQKLRPQLVRPRHPVAQPSRRKPNLPPPRPKKQTAITRPIGSEFNRRGTPKAVQKAQKAAHRKHEQNLRRAPGDPRLPIVPLFKARYLDRHPKQRAAVLDAYQQGTKRIADDLDVTKSPAARKAFIASGFKSVPEYVEATHKRDDLAGYHAAARSELRSSRAAAARGALEPSEPQPPISPWGGAKPQFRSLVPGENAKMQAEYDKAQRGKRREYRKDKRSYRRAKRAYRQFEKAPLREQARVGRQLEVAAAQSPHRGEAQERTKEKQKTFGFSTAHGIPVPRLDWTAGRVLDEAARPLHGTANAALAAQQGKPIGRAFVRGLQNKDKTLFGDVLRAKGAGRAEALILGTAGDVLFDPLNFVTLGRKAPANIYKTLALRAEEASQTAKAAGRAKDAERLAGEARKYAEQAAKAPTNKGIQVGLGSPIGPARVSTKGKLWAKASKATGLSGAATKLRETPLVQGLGRTLNPRFRPTGVNEREWQKYLDANTTARATARTGEKQAERRGQAYHRALKPDEGRAVIDAIETRTVAHLPQHLREVAQVAEKELRQVGEAEQAADLIGHLRDGYIPHQWSEHLAETRKGRKKQTKLKNEFAEAREVEGTIHAINAERASRGKEPLFSENLAHVMTKRLAKSAERIADKHRIDEIATEVGRPIQLPDTTADVAKAGQDIEQHNERFFESLRNAGRYHQQEQELQSTIDWAQHEIARAHVAGDQAALNRAQGALDVATTNKRTLEEARAAEMDAGTEAERNFYAAQQRGEEAARRGQEVPLANLREADSLYKVDQKGFHPLESDKGEIDVAAARKALANGERVVAMPRVIGQMEVRAKFRKSDAFSEGPSLGASFDRFMSKVKTTLTVLNVPAYDLRNLSGDLFNAYLADTDARSIGTALRLVGGPRRQMNRAEKRIGDEFTTTRVVKIRNRRVPADDLLRWADEDGVTGTGWVGGERFELARAGQGAKGRVRDVRPVETLRGVGEARENVVRLGTYISALRRGWTRKEARDWANKHHFDYNELTDTERGFLRRLFPFYTFTARNTALQATKLFSRPGKYVNYEALRQEMAKDANLPEGWEQELQSYQQRGVGIPVKVGGQTRMFYPGLPITDLNRLAALADPPNEAQLAIQNINPVLKSIAEPLLNYNFFFREAIFRTKDKPDAPKWVPAPGWAQWLQETTGVDIGVVMKPQSRGRGDDMPKWPALMDYFARLLPQSNFATQVTTSARGSRGQTSKEALFSQLTGVKAGAYDPNKNALNRAYDYANELQSRINDAQDSGEFHKAKKLRKEQQKVRDQIRKLRKGQGLPVTPKDRGGGGGIPAPASSGGGGSGGAGIPSPRFH